MKRVVLLTIMIAFVVCSSVLAKGVKIGYADALKIFNGYTKTKNYEKVLRGEKQKAEKDNNLQAKKNAIIKMQDKLGLLKGKEKIQQQAKIKKAIIEYRNLASKVYIGLKKDSDKEMKEILNDIRLSIKTYAVKNGFSLIINKTATLYGKDGIDLTDSILQDLNKTYKK